MTNDPIYEAFLRRQAEDGAALASESDILELTVLDDAPSSRFLARFRAKSVFAASGHISEDWRDFLVGIQFPPHYLRWVDPLRVLTLVAPHHVFHPNIRPPFICVGFITPGTGLVDLLYRVYDVVSFHKVAPHDALNAAACAWARGHRDRFPVDPRPLRRRRR